MNPKFLLIAIVLLASISCSKESIDKSNTEKETSNEFNIDGHLLPLTYLFDLNNKGLSDPYLSSIGSKYLYFSNYNFRISEAPTNGEVNYLMLLIIGGFDSLKWYEEQKVGGAINIEITPIGAETYNRIYYGYFKFGQNVDENLMIEFESDTTLFEQEYVNFKYVGPFYNTTDGKPYLYE